MEEAAEDGTAREKSGTDLRRRGPLERFAGGSEEPVSSLSRLNRAECRYDDVGHYRSAQHGTAA